MEGSHWCCGGRRSFSDTDVSGKNAWCSRGKQSILVVVVKHPLHPSPKPMHALTSVSSSQLRSLQCKSLLQLVYIFCWEGLHFPGRESLIKRNGMSVPNFERTLRDTKILLCGRCYHYFLSLRGSNYKTIHYLLSVFYSPKCFEGTAKALAVNDLRLKTLRGTTSVKQKLNSYTVSTVVSWLQRVLDQCVEQEGDPSSKDFKVSFGVSSKLVNSLIAHVQFTS